MAITDIPSMNALASSLDRLLQRALTIKKTTTINPPLQVSELSTDGEALYAHIAGDKEARMLAVESAAKDVFYGVLGSTRVNDPAFVTIWNLLDILQHLGDRDLCMPHLALLLVEEMLDSQSIAGCRTVFSFLESRREAIIAEPNKNKDLVILRLCNELLRQLSRAEDPVFCGRVYVFMFQSFPLGDKSSVNLRGNFHVENATTFEDYLKTEAQESEEMQLDSKSPTQHVRDDLEQDRAAAKPAESGTTENKEPPTMDIENLYPEFWSLQHSFSNPPRVFDEEKFKQFRNGIEVTLAKFKEVPKVIQFGDSENKQDAKVRSDDDYDEYASTFNPKYLTSRDLFKLEENCPSHSLGPMANIVQLSDLAFQRHILVQALILIEFLLTLTEESKKKPSYLNAQKAMQYSFTLREDDTAWALGIKNSIANYLQEGPEGKIYYRMVDTVLSRDRNWVRWKMENCPPFSRNRFPPKYFLEAKSGAQKAVAAKSFVLNAADSMVNGGRERKLPVLKPFTVPSVESYVQKVRAAELDLEMADSEEEKQQLEEKKTSNTWRGLRLASNKHLNHFNRLESGKGLERLFQPIEAAGEDNAPTTPEDRGVAPQGEHQSVGEQRPGQRSQVTADSAPK
ncbi:nuclear matrix protein [Massariosphaeria phaeospora]|uniref:Nuclear matrix protein n=1 Tax=Massariosphaeria phaeospora TaxID=100035 RepID=A0A7C8I6B5_9PLEO|nr:nuclear matrix protein [Massariosphaeria phaeospora]